MSNDLAPRLQKSLGEAFTLERELGGGGMARVFLAQDRALERRVVVKVLDLEGAVDASAERFRREVKVIAQLQHPHIVPVLTAGGDGTLLWYVMPYVAGESLRARLVREGALPVADALRIARELLDALAYAHERGIMHRDVKPENILLEGRHAVVADFGVAKALADAGVSGAGLTSVGLALGTPAYMAPEQAMADPTTNHRADLYASGVVLYEMLAGAPPYAGSAQAVVASHLTSPVPRIEERRTDVPPAVASLITRLMAKTPAERPQSAHEVAIALEAVTTPGGSVGMPAATMPAAMPAPVLPAARRKVPRIAAGAVAAAVVIAGVLWWRDRAEATPVAEGADIIAVIPFGSTGDSSLSRLGRDLVVTLSTNLDGVGSLRAVDAMSVIQRAQLLAQPVPLEGARELGTALGARSVLHGSLVREGDLVRANVALHAVEGGEPIARFTFAAPPESLRTFTDSMSAELLRQVWRRGQPPSPLLADVATASGDALRAFLAGERAFERAATEEALEAYTRAVEADSSFAQAWLRIDYTRSLALMGPDSMVRRRLNEVRLRLPTRDRELLDLRRATNLTLHQRVDSGRVLAARYPDYHTAQYQVGDNIIHAGPTVGIPLSQAVPYLERLEVLAPHHADNALHRLMVMGVLGDSAGMRDAATDLVERAPGELGAFGKAFLRMLDGRAAGRRIPMDTMLAGVREFLDQVRVIPAFQWFAGGFHSPDGSRTASAELIAQVRRSGMAAGYEAALLHSEGILEFSRGNSSEGVRILLRLLDSRAPAQVRLSGARSAAQAAWLGTIPVSEAETAVSRTRSTVTGLEEIDALELEWADGVIAIAAQDSARLLRAIARMDTTRLARSLGRELRALWRERRTGAIDSLVAAADDAMRTSTTFSSSNPLSRAAIGRGLVRRGDPARAEHYQQWGDAVVNTARAISVQAAMGPYASYDRGLAREAAGDRFGAILHLQRFVEGVDRPTPAVQQQVDDAKARLKRLTGKDR
jgi:TolB-like protein